MASRAAAAAADLIRRLRFSSSFPPPFFLDPLQYTQKEFDMLDMPYKADSWVGGANAANIWHLPVVAGLAGRLGRSLGGL